MSDVEGLDDGLDIKYEFSEEELDVNEEEGGAENNDDAEKEVKAETKENEEPSSTGKKRKGLSEGKKSKKKAKMEFEKESKAALSVEKNDIVVEKLNSKMRELFPQFSALELTEYYVNKKQVVDTSEFEGERSLENMARYIETYMKDLIPSIKAYKALRNKLKKYETKRKFNKKFNKTVEIPKRKFILVLSISAIRSCDVHRATRDLEGGSVKLINKNPIGHDLKILKTTWSRILNATPGRIDKLLQVSKDDVQRNFEPKPVFSEEEIDTVILDNFVDPKLRSVLDDVETYECLKKLKAVNPDLKVYVY